MTVMEEEKATAQPLPDVTFDEFAPTAYETWKEEAIVSLKGGVFEKKLFTNTYEGIRLEPIYTPAHVPNLPGELPGFADFLRSTKAGGYITKPWTIAQECNAVLPEELNELLRHELAKGSSGLQIVLDEATQAGLDADQAAWDLVGIGGASLGSLQDVQAALQGLDVTKQELFVAAGASSLGFIALLEAWLEANGQKQAQLSGCVGADPLGRLAAKGVLSCSLDQLYDEMAHCVGWATAHMPTLRTILIDGQVYHEGGAQAVQEVAYALATGIAYIRALQLRGLTIAEIAPQMSFRFALGANYFMEVAKLRMARRLWAEIVAAFGGSEDAQKMHIQARTARFNKTVYDPYVNMLRTTTEAFSAVVGGADALHVGCFDEAIRNGDVFSRRIARNTQIMLQNECNLLQPVDPAGGSWYIESLTDQLAEKVWALLQSVEGQGGMLNALQQNVPQQAIQAVLKERWKKLAVRADRAVGTNMYPNVTEERLHAPEGNRTEVVARRVKEMREFRAEVETVHCAAKLDALANGTSNEAGALLDAAVAAIRAGATLGQIYAAVRLDENSGDTIEPVTAHRLTEQFEAMRGKTEAYREAQGKECAIFLAGMGPIPQHKARADFSTGFLEVAAFKVLRNDGYATVEEAAQAAVNSGALAAVICSTDDTYPELVPPLARRIKELKPAMKVLLAGAPAPEMEPVYREAGVDEYIHVKANCYQILSWLQQVGGIA